MKNYTLREMNIEIYGNICMAGYTLSRSNPLTMHHIVPLSWGGRTTLENSSNITFLPHTGIHVLYDDDKQKAKKIMEYLYCFKEHPDEWIVMEFKQWLENELFQMDYIPTQTRGKVMVYKRR